MAATKKAPRAKKPAATKGGTSLVLRTCSSDMTSHGGFVWPGVGETAVCPDWIANTKCGNGLHGWLYGTGVHSCSSYLDETAKWLLVEVESDSIQMLGGKCKFPRAVVRFVGDRKEATDYLIANEPRAAGCAVIGASLTVGDVQAVIVGALGTAVAGDGGEIRIRWYDEKADRYRTMTGYIGEGGLKKDTAYRLDANHKFAEAQP